VTKATRLNLLICGAMRSGTTSLKAHMSEHPEIGFVDGEDIVVGDRYTGYYPFASPSLAQSLLGDDPKVYERISARLAGKKRYIADKRAYFMFFPHIPFNLREQLPDARLIFILRNPVEIAYSAFWYGERQPGSAQTFEAYLAESIARIDHVSSSFRRNEWLDHFRPGSELPVLVERGLYYPQIVRFYRLFRKEQILVLRFDRLKENPAAVMREVLRFLISPMTLNSPTRVEYTTLPLSAHPWTPGSGPACKRSMPDRTASCFLCLDGRRLFGISAGRIEGVFSRGRHLFCGRCSRGPVSPSIWQIRPGAGQALDGWVH